MAVIAAGVAAANESLRIPPLLPWILRQHTLGVVDDVAAALEGAHVLLAIAAQSDAPAGALQHVRGFVPGAGNEAVAVELFRAARRQRDCGPADVVPLRVLVKGDEIDRKSVV